MRGTDYGLVGAAGAGIEWFVTTNIALSVEAKYHYFMVGHTLHLAGRERDAHPDAVLATAGVRVYFGALPW